MVRSTLVVIALAFASAPAPAPAQHEGSYAGREKQEVKGLSVQQIADLRAGRGMGLALPAELNGYPGPSHTLELADKLGLSPDQRARITVLFAAMKAEAVPIGEHLIRQESDLDRQFASRAITSDTLKVTTVAIGATQAELRNAHLKYHLATLDVLTPDQIKRYAELRGYAGAPTGEHGHRP